MVSMRLFILEIVTQITLDMYSNMLSMFDSSSGWNRPAVALCVQGPAAFLKISGFTYIKNDPIVRST